MGNVKLTTPSSVISPSLLISPASAGCTNLYGELVSTLCQQQFLIKMKEWNNVVVNQKQKYRTSFFSLILNLLK